MEIRQTKIVATMGPAVHYYDGIKSLVEAGLDVARLNFSHDVYDAHKQRTEWVRQAAQETGRPVAVLQDLQGPKIRTGKLKSEGPVTLIPGDMFTITIEDILGDEKRVGTTYKTIANDVNPSDRILISDGNIELKVESVTDTDVICKIIHGGSLGHSQGINLPGTDISLPSLTEKDIRDLQYGLENLDVDFVALSFVRQAQDILDARKIIEAAGSDAKIVAKLERPESVENLEAILEVADAVMVARGDMGVELDPENVPLVQKRIIQEANKRSIPVITATQMLESMTKNPRPTRAEISDVANAILDGSDAVMLSGETSMGKFPAKAVKMMDRIARQVESSNQEIGVNKCNLWEYDQFESSPEAIGAAISTISQSLPVKSIWTLTLSGSSAQLISRYRLRKPVFAFTPNEKVVRQLTILWGVHPIKVDFYNSLGEFESQVRSVLSKYGVNSPEDMVVIAGGHPTDEVGPTNFIKIDQPLKRK